MLTFLEIPIGCPWSRVSSSASSSAFRSIRSATLQSSCARAAGASERHSPSGRYASRARATASSTSAGPASGTSAITSPVAGSIVSSTCATDAMRSPSLSGHLQPADSRPALLCVRARRLRVRARVVTRRRARRVVRRGTRSAKRRTRRGKACSDARGSTGPTARRCSPPSHHVAPDRRDRDDSLRDVACGSMPRR